MHTSHVLTSLIRPITYRGGRNDTTQDFTALTGEILSVRFALPLHTFVRFEPIPGKENQLREEVKLLLEPTCAEPGCIRIQLYEALREPLVFYIHSEWVDEAAFDAHPKLPHMTRFLNLVGGLTTHPVKGIRTKEIG